MIPKWDKTYSMHNVKLDEQHQELFKLAEKVEFMSDKPIHRQELKDLLTGFFHYIKDHFNEEEKYMKMIKYPDFKNHHQHHREITRSMIYLIRNVKTTNDLKEKFYTIVNNWVLKHTLTEDMKIEKYRQSLISRENDELMINSKEEEEKNTTMYFYMCDCNRQLHNIPFEVHKAIQAQKSNFRCKKCKQRLRFHKEQAS